MDSRADGIVLNMTMFAFERVTDQLPQTEMEWMSTGKFDVQTVVIEGRPIRCALARGAAGKPLITMAGGIPREPERRNKLPLINKLYGSLALKFSERDQSSLLYNQPATGGSGGEWDRETLRSRAEALAGISGYFYDSIHPSGLALFGSSAGGYMAVKSLDLLESKGIRVPKIALLSPAAYPEAVEDVPYGETFTGIVRSPWNVSESPVFSRLEKYVGNGGKVLIAFFEQDDPPIPIAIQAQYKALAERLSAEGGAIKFTVIPNVAHNFRRIPAVANKNVIDDESIKASSAMFDEFFSGQ